MPETLWYYEDSGRQMGPVTEAALREQLRSGRLGRDARVWRSGMPGWRRWHEVAELGSARPAEAAGSAPLRPGDLDKVDLALLVVLSIVTFGVYGFVVFYRVGDRYGRLAPARRSTFETYFWIYVSLWALQFLGWATFGPLVVLAGLAAFVVGVLLLNEALALRAEVVRANGVRVELMSDTAHRALWIIGSLTTFIGIGIVFLVVQAFKFFDDHNQLVAAIAAAGPRDAGGPLVTPPPPAPPPTPSAVAEAPFATVAVGAAADEPLPAERACLRCGGPLGPADRFCSRCGAAAG